MGPKKSNRRNSSKADKHNEASDKDEEQYVAKEFFDQQMKYMMESLSSSIQANL